jgi:hypothetical protein
MLRTGLSAAGCGVFTKPSAKGWIVVIFSILAFGASATGAYGVWVWVAASREAAPDGVPPMTALWFFVGLASGGGIVGAALLKLGLRMTRVEAGTGV